MKFYVNADGEFAVTSDGAQLCDSYKLLKPNSTDAAQEKHVPVVTVSGNTVAVKVGSVPHPMTEAHLISVIILETTHGYQLKKLCHTDAPEAEFVLAAGESAVAVYEYCNMHGLWVAAL